MVDLKTPTQSRELLDVYTQDEVDALFGALGALAEKETVENDDITGPVELSKLVEVNGSRLLGRGLGAGVGPIVPLGAADALAILGLTSAAEDIANLQGATSTAEKGERASYLSALDQADRDLPPAAVVVLMGQSLNAPREQTPAQRYAARNGLMPVGGLGLRLMDMSAANVEHTPDHAEFATFADLDETATYQSPASGVANAMAWGFPRVYICSAAIGARQFGTLQGGGPRAALHAIVHRMCEAARADGFRPVVFGSLAEGEADAANGTSENDLYEYAVNYMRLFQVLAAQAMRKPQYVAPITVAYPVQSNGSLGSGANDRAVKEGLRRAIRDVEGAIDLGGIYHRGISTDLVHPTALGYVKNGEAHGRAMLAAYQQGQFAGHDLEITDVILSGTTFTARFSQAVARDASTAWATALPGTDGFEWDDNGTARTITDLAYTGNVVTGTVTGITGTIAQQTLRVASQANAPNGFLEEVPGSYVRAVSGSWYSWVDPSFINYIWAKPQVFSDVRDAL